MQQHEVKQYNNWKGSLSDYLKPGELVDEDIQLHFLEFMPPIVIGGFVQLGEPYEHNDKGATYLTLYKNIYLGVLNDVRHYKKEAQTVVKEITESLKVESSKHHNTILQD